MGAEAKGAAAHSKPLIIGAISHRINRVKAKSPEDGGGPAAPKGPATAKAAPRGGPGDQHGKTPTKGQKQLGKTKPSLGGGINQH
jgi:hypothetical protein